MTYLPRSPNNHGRRYTTMTPDSRCKYTTEQLRFIVTMQALKERLRRMPSDREVFREAVRIGYRRVADPVPLPTFSRPAKKGVS